MADQAPQPPVGGIEHNIFAQIRKEQQDFMYNWISIVPGYPFNQYMTIKKNHLYLNSKFEDLSLYNGKEKQFFNINIPPCEVATRMLNVDSKNIKLWPMEPKSFFSTYLLEKELKQWLKKSKMGKLLNTIAEEAPKYGSVALEKITDGAKLVDLRRLVLDPTVENIKDSRFITTISYMSETELRETGWNNIDIAIERYSNLNAAEPYEDAYVNVNVMRSTPYIKIFKRYGEVPAWWLDEKLSPGTKTGDQIVRALYIVAGADWLMKNNDGKAMSELGVILFKSRWRKDWPFRDFHYTKTKGRWLGIGVVEMLYQVQERINEIKNQKRVSMEISSLHLFQSQDKSIVRNILTDLQSGDLMITGKSGIEPIANEERNLAAYEQEETSYLNQADKLTFAYEAIRGDAGDTAQDTLGQTQIAVAQGTSVFAFKKENLGLFLQEYFNDLVMPQLMKDLTPEHIMRFTGTSQELEKLDEAAAEVHANDYIKKQMLSGKLALPEQWDAAKQKAIETYRKLGENRFLKMKEAFYDDTEFEFDFIITNEQADPSKIAQNVQTVIAEYNPQFVQDPLYQLMFSKLLEQMGVSQAEFEIAVQKSSAQQQQIASQQPSPTPVASGQSGKASGTPLPGKAPLPTNA